ncbi:uncharacterized protein LOC124912475 isoform X1 [Impatiens glandulifera]|uniref:uncharacterized protein LOC124912475 isoform X1 n=1 Tax=Impatiens glandulifera TaxID=253017 RepID=UPI001FB0F177|nr:uncharacterized protein LOC124912475 isoform X1 [Impatiens glandulifera]
MGDLHSIPYTNTFASSSSLDSVWDFQMNNIGISNNNSYMENTPPPSLTSNFEDDGHDQFSTGYLQDALSFELDRSKRRRLLLFAGDQTFSSQICMNSIPGYWDSSDSSTTENSGEDLCCLAQITSQTSINSGSGVGFDDDIGVAFQELSSKPDSFQNNLLLGCFSDTNNSKKTTALSNSSSLQGPPTLTSSHNLSLDLGEVKFDERAEKLLGKRSPKKITRVVYPFAMVKPPGGGAEGAFTLNDINERILMPPTRPLRHPVGDYACRPILSPQGPGLSGKAVVAFTRIHTQGRGTITIIRTKG